MSETAKCSACGAELSPDAAQGLCAGCLLKLGLSSTNITAEQLPPPRSPEPQVVTNRRSSGRLWRISLIIIAAASLLVFVWVLARQQESSLPQASVFRFSLSLPNA